jgi:hypothetical protein
MIEKVARAIYEADPESGYHPDDRLSFWAGDGYSDEVWNLWRAIARAAIEAMREPTDAMDEAGSAVHEASDTDPHREWNGADIDGIWKAMIDEALNQTASIG